VRTLVHFDFRGLDPDRGRIRKDFPYYGAPYTAEEQVGVTPMRRPAKK
jgi:hypothetical protein